MALRIKLVKSVNGRKPNYITTLRLLGLIKINQIVEKEATPDILGKIHLVSYLVQVEEV